MTDRENVHWSDSKARLLVLADGHLGTFQAKTAVGLLRYRVEQVVAVLDRGHAGGDCGAVLDVGSGVPIVGGVAEAMSLGPTAMVIGVATSGGRLPEGWDGCVSEALERGLDIVNGLHQRLSDDARFAAIAREKGCEIHEIRRFDGLLSVASARSAETKARRLLTVGSDCNVGKMVAALELVKSLGDRGLDARFVATGQTGILIGGKGICVDAVVSDFIAGAAEKLVIDEADADVIAVEGQGSLVHPAFSGVTLGLMHGTLPHAMVLVHRPGRATMRRTTVPIPPLSELVALHESIMAPLFTSKMVGVVLNCHGMSDDEARRAIASVEDELSLPVTDCVRFGAERIADAVMESAS